MTQTINAFDLAGKARLKHINLRKEGDDDQKELASDLKFEINTSADILLAFHPQLRLMLFNPDGSVRFQMMGPVSWQGEFRGMALRINPNMPGERTFLGVKCKGFVFNPKADFTVEMTLSAQLHPQTGETNFLADCLHEDVQIAIESAGDLFSSGGKGDTNPAKALSEMHENALRDGVTLSIRAGETEIIFGALKDEILEKFKAAGKAEADREDGGDYDKGYAYACLGYAKPFLDEHAAELEKAYADGYDIGGQ